MSLYFFDFDALPVIEHISICETVKSFFVESRASVVVTIVVAAIISLVLASAGALCAAKHYRASTELRSGFKTKGRVNPAPGCSITTHSQQVTKERKVLRSPILEKQQKKVKKQREIAQVPSPKTLSGTDSKGLGL